MSHDTPDPRAGKRAGNVRAAFARAAGPTAPPTLDPVTDPAPARDPRGSKFTVLLGVDDALAFDEVALRVRRQLGRRADKSAIVRALIALAVEDDALTRQISDAIRQAER